MISNCVLIKDRDLFHAFFFFNSQILEDKNLVFIQLPKRDQG